MLGVLSWKFGHFARDCPVKMSKVEILKKKMLAEMEEVEKALMAEDEYWCDHSDDEEQAQVTLMADTDSENIQTNVDEGNTAQV